MAHQQGDGVTFALEKEDHTLANALRFFLNKNPNVSFCGYSMPHPSEEVVNVRVQTTGDVAASEALRTACEDVKEVCNHINSRFLDAVAKHRASNPGAAP